MLINFYLISYVILVVIEQCSGIHFLELPGFDSEVSHEHLPFKKPSKTDTSSRGAHRPHHKKSVDYKNFRRMEEKLYRQSKKFEQQYDSSYEHEMTIIPAVNKNMESQNINTAEEVETGFQYRNSPIKQKQIPVHGVEGKQRRNSKILVVRENIESQYNNAAALQTNHQKRYPSLKQEVPLVYGDERKHFRNTEIPVPGDIEPQNKGKEATVYTERQNRYPLITQEVTPLHNVDKKPWRNTRVTIGRENMEPQNVGAEEVQPQYQSRYPPLNHKVREDMEPHNIDTRAQTERQGRYPPLKQKLRENDESHNDGGMQTDLQNRYPPIKEKTSEPQNIDATEIIQPQHQRGYPPLKQRVGEDIEPQNTNSAVQNEGQDRYPPLKPNGQTDFIERRHWLVARKDAGDSSNIPPINKDDKDATLKAKINMLVNQTVRDTDEKVKSTQDIKDAHREKAPYKIGFIVSMVKKSRDVLNELFNVAVKHRDEWKALEQLKIFELIVHTNVDTTNLVRQLVEIHVQHLNSTSSGGDETTEATGGGRRVVLI